MPNSTRYDEGLAGLKRNGSFARLFVEDEIDGTVDEIEELIAVEVHLSCMGRASRHSGLSRETAGDVGMSATTLHDRLD